MTEETRLLKYRREHFACEVKPARHPQAEGEISLAVTTNGSQWQSITLLPEEVEKVVAMLRAKASTDGDMRR